MENLILYLAIGIIFIYYFLTDNVYNNKIKNFFIYNLYWFNKYGLLIKIMYLISLIIIWPIILICLIINFMIYNIFFL